MPSPVDDCMQHQNTKIGTIIYRQVLNVQSSAGQSHKQEDKTIHISKQLAKK